ncbi:hypothetical protein RHGRI_011744 [Rhododendron griersonianum]|uniref:Uncharacterized protein n=1 Tax=Rhododendron griersonianum TaxID=479676 RepID=A0AAV6KN08_9ERIC|nr:hypothetical protein RHGRI_011744 [Rhododendron griersonianum]
MILVVAPQSICHSICSVLAGVVLDSVCRPKFVDHAPQLKGKRSWPELVGLVAHEAAWKIQEEMPEAQIEVVHTLEFKYNRVRLHVDSSGKVRFAPREG